MTKRSRSSSCSLREPSNDGRRSLPSHSQYSPFGVSTTFGPASRNFVAQLGTILMINIVLGIAASGYIDNFAHIGGFVTGGLIGVAFVPGRVATIRSMWQAGSSGQLASGFIGSAAGRIAALLVLVALMGIAAASGMSRWG